MLANKDIFVVSGQAHSLTEKAVPYPRCKAFIFVEACASRNFDGKWFLMYKSHKTNRGGQEKIDSSVRSPQEDKKQRFDFELNY